MVDGAGGVDQFEWTLTFLVGGVVGVAGRRGRLWLGGLIWAGLAAVVGSGLMIAGNAATDVDGRWPLGLELVREHPFRWVAGLTVATAAVGVLWTWWQTRLELVDDTMGAVGEIGDGVQVAAVGESSVATGQVGDHAVIAAGVSATGSARMAVVGQAGPVYLGDVHQHLAASATVSPQVRDAEQVVFGVIPRQARWFQPRPMEQDALKQALADSHHVGLVALPGARGAGKSQLAAAYARQCAADGFDVVAWINAQTIPDDESAETRERLLGPVSELAQLGALWGLDTGGGTPEQVAAACIRAVSVRDGKRRLLVFDNVDDPDSIVDFLPATGTAKVLITTNRQEVTAMAGVTPVRVDMFTPEQGRAFFTEATDLPDTDHTRALGENLGWLPLGLAQAAAVIVLNQWSYQDYRRRLAAVDVSRALIRLAGAQHPGVLAATTLSIQTLQRQDPAGDAFRLLTLLSLLAPEGTSRAFLKDPQAVTAMDMDDTRLDRALSALVNASLATQGQTLQARPNHDDTVIVTVHRLTGKVVRHHVADANGQPPADLITQTAQTLTALAQQLGAHEVAHRRDDLNELVTHIYTLRSHTDQPTLEMSWLANWAGQRLDTLGDAARAIALHERNLADRERLLGAEHPDTLNSRNNLAASYRTAGRLDEAIALHEQNLADRERLLGAEHPDTLNSRNNLAATYWATGRHVEASRLEDRR